MIYLYRVGIPGEIRSEALATSKPLHALRSGVFSAIEQHQCRIHWACDVQGGVSGEAAEYQPRVHSGRGGTTIAVGIQQSPIPLVKAFSGIDKPGSDQDDERDASDCESRRPTSD